MKRFIFSVVALALALGVSRPVVAQSGASCGVPVRIWAKAQAGVVSGVPVVFGDLYLPLGQGQP